MSTHTVNYALTDVSRRIRNNPFSFSESGLRKLLSICDCMRHMLMGGCIDDFDRYLDNVMAREPDAADWILEDLFEELGITDREQLSTILTSEP